MAKILSFLSWNVENFHNEHERVDRIVDRIAEKAPDVFGIYEVKGAAVFNAMVTKMPDYAISITESPSVPEILIGVRNNLTSFVTQRNEFQSKVPSLRPGSLATIHIDGENYSFLFLHLKSFPQPRDWGLRDDMFQHVASLKRTIDKSLPEGKKANFISLGDINTMGMKAAYNDRVDLTGAEELSFLDNRMTADVNGMRRLVKTHDATWWSGKDKDTPSDLDHVYAADHLQFRNFGGDAEIEVSGWVNKATKDDKREWIGNFSDHSFLFGELHD